VRSGRQDGSVVGRRCSRHKKCTVELKKKLNDIKRRNGRNLHSQHTVIDLFAEFCSLILASELHPDQESSVAMASVFLSQALELKIKAYSCMHHNSVRRHNSCLSFYLHLVMSQHASTSTFLGTLRTRRLVPTRFG
jgi:hypothetical protein